MDLSVVMPCLDEERTVGTCVEKALRAIDELGLRGEVLVIDNGSTDESAQRAERAGAKVIHEPRKGYGNALRRGFDEARGGFILMGDCDDSYDFAEIQQFLVRLRGGADLVIGDRFAGGIKPGAMPWLHRRVGNPGLTCPECQEVVREFATRATPDAGDSGGGRVALVELPPFGDPRQNDGGRNVSCKWCRLTQSFRWFVDAPVVLHVRDGKVLSRRDPTHLRQERRGPGRERGGVS